MQITSHIQYRLAALGVAAMAVAVTLTSCSNDAPEDTPLREITVSGNHGTFATRTDGAPLDPDYKMWVTSLYHSTQQIDRKYHLLDVPFVSSTVDDNTIWSAQNGAYYYPLSGKMDFVAYAVMNSAHKPVAQYHTSSPLDNASVEEPYIDAVELDFTNTEQELDGDDDLLVSAVVPGAPCGKDAKGAVPLKFIHLMSNVRFIFTAISDEAAAYMKLAAVQIHGMRKAGVARLTREKGGDWTVEWPAEKLTRKTQLRREISMFPIYNSTDYVEVDFFFPPQHVGVNTSFSITCRHCTPSYEGEEQQYILKNYADTSIDFMPGKRYTYNVQCRMFPQIEFHVSLVDDENGIILDKWVTEPVVEL